METLEKTENPIGLRALLDAGVHFGHNTGRWNPRMKPYIFGARNGVHIIDLQQTVTMFGSAFQAVIDVVARGEKVLFVGTKKQAADVIAAEADRAGQYYVTERWLGGTLTNFKTVRQSLDRLRDLEKRETDGSLLGLSKKEQLSLSRQKEKLLKSLGGIKNMSKLPGLMFIVDPSKEHIALFEANKLEIPVVAVTDTNCDPTRVDYVIPGNDDAIRSIKLFASRIADACVIGQRLAKERGAQKAKNSSGPREQVIHVSGGADGGPKVELASGGSRLVPEASAAPEPEAVEVKEAPAETAATETVETQG